MSNIYELWDRATANLIGTYESVDQALAVFDDVALGSEDEDGDTTVIATGEDLVALAFTSDTSAEPTAVPQRIRRTG
jgi:hypothetical protein